MVVLGHPNTLSVTMDEMLHHARAVARGARSALLIGDMPFMSYQADEAEALRNAGRFLKEAGMEAVKLEGGRDVAPVVRRIVRAGIPVQGHIGLTPQSVNALGGWKVQGRTAAAARSLIEDALALEDAGAFRRLGDVLLNVPFQALDHIGKGFETKRADREADERSVERLERWIDQLDLEIPPLRHFILSDGAAAGASLHLARTVTRRAERRIAALMAREMVNPAALKYANRLSDLLFVLARHCNARGKRDVLWVPGANR